MIDFLCARLSRPTGFYLPLLLDPDENMLSSHVAGISMRQPLGLVRNLEKKKLQPTARWHGSKKDYVPPSKNPTPTKAPSAKGKADSASARTAETASSGGGGGSGKSDLDLRPAKADLTFFAPNIPKGHASYNVFNIFACKKFVYE